MLYVKKSYYSKGIVMYNDVPQNTQ
jgi:hypothetical protein